MRAHLNMIALADMTGDGKTIIWLKQLLQIDPHWFRPHELAAQVFRRERKIDDALREATIARHLAPYSDSATKLWSDLNAQRRDIAGASTSPP